MSGVYFLEFRLRRESQPVDGVGPDVGPLAEFLRRLGEGHVGRDGTVDDGLLTLHADDAVEPSWRVVEEGDADSRTGGRHPRPLRLRVDVEDVSLAREDRLLTENY